MIEPNRTSVCREPADALRLCDAVPGLQITVDSDPGITAEVAAAGRHSPAALLRDIPVEARDWTAPPAASPRLVLRFHSAPVAALGGDRVQTMRVTDRNTGTRDIPAGLLIRSIGSRGVPIPGLPFDFGTGVIPNTAGRVSPGSYVAGWAKRGAAGGIGANRACAAETVGALLDDAAAGRLPAPNGSAKAFDRLIRSRRRSSPWQAPCPSPS